MTVSPAPAERGRRGGGILLGVILTQRAVDRALRWGSLAVALASALACVGNQLLSPTDYPPGVFAASMMLLALAIGRVFVELQWQRDRVWGTRALVVLPATLLTLQALARFPAPDVHVVPSWTHLAMTMTVVSSHAFGPAVTRLLAPAYALLYGWVRWGTGSLLEIVCGAGLQLVVTLVSARVIALLQRTATRVEAALEDQWANREQVERVARAAHERVRWDGLVHDKVLGALWLAARGDLERARPLAADSLAAIARTGAHSPGPPDLRTDLRADLLRFAAGHGITLDVLVEGTPPAGEPGEALLRAAEQALANVERHSGVTCARVRMRCTDEGVSVVVSDAGRGFDPGAVPAGRIGISHGVRARMLAVGGDATVRSAPGQGTEVTLTWAARSTTRPDSGVAAPSANDPTWRPEDLSPIVVLGAASVLVHVVMAVDYRHSVHSLMLLGAIAAGFVGVLLAMMWTPRQALGAWAGLVASTLALVALATVNLVDPTQVSWQYWYAGVTNSVVSLVVTCRSPRWGLLLSLAAPATVAVVQICRAAFTPAALIDAFSQLPTLAVACWAIVSALGGATAYVNEVSAQTGVARLRAAQLEIADQEATRRTRLMGERVTAMLTRIVDGSPFTAAEQADCAGLEASTRDGLVAATLLDPQVVEAVARARARGVQVRLLSDTAPAPGVAAVRATIGHLADAAAQAVCCAGSGAPMRTGGSGRWRSSGWSPPTPAPSSNGSPGLPHRSGRSSRSTRTVCSSS